MDGFTFEKARSGTAPYSQKRSNMVQKQSTSSSRPKTRSSEIHQSSALDNLNVELRENRPVIEDNDDGFDMNKALNDVVRRRMMQQQQQQQSSANRTSSTSAYSAPALVPNLTKSQRSKQATIQLKPTTPKSNLSEMNAIYGASSNGAAHDGNRVGTSGGTRQSKKLNMQQQIMADAARAKSRGSSRASSRNVSSKTSAPGVDNIYNQMLKQQNQLKSKSQQGHQTLAKGRPLSTQQQQRQQSKKGEGIFESEASHRKQPAGESAHLNQEGLLRQQRRLLQQFEYSSSDYRPQSKQSSFKKRQQDEGDNYQQWQYMQAITGESSTNSFQHQHEVQSELVAESGLANGQEQLLNEEHLQEVSPERKTYQTDDSNDNEERTLIRPQSRKLYLGSDSTNQGRSDRAPKSAGAIKTESNVNTLKRLNSFGGFLGTSASSATFDKRPPSRQSSAFPVHLAEKQGKEKAPSTRTAPSTPRGNNIEKSTYHPIFVRNKDNEPQHSPDAGGNVDDLGWDRPPSRQKICAQDLWDGRKSRQGTGSMSMDRMPSRGSPLTADASRAHQNPKSDGFLELEDVVNAPFNITFNNSDNPLEDEDSEDVESIESMGTIEEVVVDDEGGRPYTVQGEELAARIENAFSAPMEIYRSSSAASPTKDILRKSDSGSPSSFSHPMPPPISHSGDRISGRQNRSQGMYKSTYDGDARTQKNSGNSWASMRNSNRDSFEDEQFHDNTLGGVGMTRMNSSPNSEALEIYDDDDDSILTEESGADLTQSMQSLTLTSSLGEDFLSLFAPG